MEVDVRNNKVDKIDKIIFGDAGDDYVKIDNSDEPICLSHYSGDDMTVEDAEYMIAALQKAIEIVTDQ
jgi:co-chaperonin GroES (HSP10)